MPAVDNAMHVFNPVASERVNSPVLSPVPAPSQHFRLSFSDLLDVINPLQHVPVVGTLYRKLTGDTIGTPEKIAGDTLYGGMMGFVSSIADTAFEAITGKNFGDTALAFLGIGDDTAGLDAGEIVQPQLALVAPAIAVDDASSSAPVARVMPEEAITAALNRAQIDPVLAVRRNLAYGRSISLSEASKPTDVLPRAY